MSQMSTGPWPTPVKMLVTRVRGPNLQFPCVVLSCHHCVTHHTHPRCICVCTVDVQQECQLFGVGKGSLSLSAPPKSLLFTTIHLTKHLCMPPGCQVWCNCQGYWDQRTTAPVLQDGEAPGAITELTVFQQQPCFESQLHAKFYTKCLTYVT